eukprot:14878484-Alexandrium_andersonii.AAC.1
MQSNVHRASPVQKVLKVTARLNITNVPMAAACIAFPVSARVSWSASEWRKSSANGHSTSHAAGIKPGAANPMISQCWIGSTSCPETKS